MSVPNIITFGRLLAVPLAVYFILAHDLGSAFWLFVAAGVSDAIDGAIARMFHARTVLGAYLDPLADKALLVSVYVALGHIGEVPLWLVILVVFRDLMIVGAVLLLYTLKESMAMQPLYVSKINTAVQIALAAVIMAPSALDVPAFSIDGVAAASMLTWLCAATTIVSGVAYVWRGGNLFDRSGGVR